MIYSLKDAIKLCAKDKKMLLLDNILLPNIRFALSLGMVRKGSSILSKLKKLTMTNSINGQVKRSVIIIVHKTCFKDILWFVSPYMYINM